MRAQLEAGQRDVDKAAIGRELMSVVRLVYCNLKVNKKSRECECIFPPLIVCSAMRWKEDHLRLAARQAMFARLSKASSWRSERAVTRRYSPDTNPAFGNNEKMAIQIGLEQGRQMLAH